MVEVNFNSDGGALVVNAQFLGDIIANYDIFLREKNSNAQTTVLSGDNLNPENDSITLPTPPVINNGRRVLLETGFVGNHPDINPNYEIRLEIFQDGELIGLNTDTGVLTGKGQFSLLFIKLAAI